MARGPIWGPAGRMTLSDAKVRFDHLIDSAPGVDDPRVRRAFSAVPREHFVGPGPWKILAAGSYVETGCSPSVLYDDVVVALLPEKQLNNGQPTLHARCLSAARIQAGERVLHIGCGTGYYTALLGELVTDAGSVRAWDVEPQLVAAASANLQARSNVRVELRDATVGPIPRSDVIYVCAGCTRPIRSWAEALSEGGRLLFPLTPGWDHGAMLMITRVGQRYRAQFVCRCSFIPCVGGSDRVEERQLADAFSKSGFESVSSLRFGKAPAESAIWLAGADWYMTCDESGSIH